MATFGGLEGQAATWQEAQAIVERHRGQWPDLSGLLVLVPDLHAAGEVARALSSAGGGALLLPRITTLHALAATAPIALRLVPQSVREVELHAALARRQPFAGADVWALAGELVALFDRMTLARSPVAADLDAFTATLREAYRAGRSRALEYEASLVHELWWAQTAQAGDAGRARVSAGAPPVPAVDAATALSLRLAAIAACIDTPVHALALEDASGVEAAFLEACARRVPVLRSEPGVAGGNDPLDLALEFAWPPAA
jgi:ATP-dependent helicase/nuclease subunit B